MQNQYELLKNEIKTFREEGHKFFNKELSVEISKKYLVEWEFMHKEEERSS